MPVGNTAILVDSHPSGREVDASRGALLHLLQPGSVLGQRRGDRLHAGQQLLAPLDRGLEKGWQLSFAMSGFQ